MVNRQDVFGAGIVGLLIEFVLHGGEFIISLLGFLAMNVDLLLPLLTTLQSWIAPEIAWLDASLINNVVLAVALLYIGVLLARLYNRYTND